MIASHCAAMASSLFADCLCLYLCLILACLCVQGSGPASLWMPKSSLSGPPTAPPPPLLLSLSPPQPQVLALACFPSCVSAGLSVTSPLESTSRLPSSWNCFSRRSTCASSSGAFALRVQLLPFPPIPPSWWPPALFSHGPQLGDSSPLPASDPLVATSSLSPELHRSCFTTQGLPPPNLAPPPSPLRHHFLLPS